MQKSERGKQDESNSAEQYYLRLVSFPCLLHISSSLRCSVGFCQQVTGQFSAVLVYVLFPLTECDGLMLELYYHLVVKAIEITPRISSL